MGNIWNTQKKEEPVKFEPDRGWSSYHENGKKQKLTEAKRNFEHKRNQTYKHGNRRKIKEEDERRAADIPERIEIYFKTKFPHDWKKDATLYTNAVDRLQRKKAALVSEKDEPSKDESESIEDKKEKGVLRGRWTKRKILRVDSNT